jgi:O-methyltransferase
MIAKIRYYVSRLMPTQIKWRLVRGLPEIVNWTAKVFQGMSPLWDLDPIFKQLYKKVRTRALIDKKRAYVLYSLSRNCAELEGDFAEVGTYRGASARILYEAAGRKKVIFCFDTFEGLPFSDMAYDPYWSKGDMNESDYEDVRKFLHEKDFCLMRGIFPASAAKLKHNQHFSLVHIDADIYQTTKDACEYFYEKMFPGGIMIFDDYGFLSCPGVRVAVDSFFRDKAEVPIYIPTGQCFVVKQENPFIYKK